jgi:hypothetical protein
MARSGRRLAQHRDEEVEDSGSGSAEGVEGHDFRRGDHRCHASMVELAFDAGKITFE